MKRKKKVWTALSLISICMITAGLVPFIMDLNSSLQGLKRQKKEVELIQSYLQYYSQNETDTFTEQIPDMMQENSLTASEETEQQSLYRDDVWYERDGITLLPEYASGTIDCILSVPDAEILRPVFTGTKEQILYDLDLWMVTCARPGYELGVTNYVIYGHNHTVQNLSFNRLQTDVKKGSLITLTKNGWTRIYSVCEILAMTREKATDLYVNEIEKRTEPNVCTIITCGRGDFRYLDLVIRGRLLAVVPASEESVRGEWNRSGDGRYLEEVQ